MKIKLKSILVLAVFFLGIISCSDDKTDSVLNDFSDPDDSEIDDSEINDPIDATTVLSDFWFGYRFESPITNPEDPGVGFVYLKIPDSGSFQGELYFSWNGCSEGVDVGEVSGTVSNRSLTGTWSGQVDGRNVGGDYSGTLNDTDTQYEGVYNNDEGKLEIVCDEDFMYYIAPNGTWFIQENGKNEELGITVDTDKSPLECSWSQIAGAAGYNVIFIDADCLNEKLNFEECYMWDANTFNNAVVFGENSISSNPSRPLVKGNTYLVTITAVNDELAPLVTNNITFVY